MDSEPTLTLAFLAGVKVSTFRTALPPPLAVLGEAAMRAIVDFDSPKVFEELGALSTCYATADQSVPCVAPTDGTVPGPISAT